MGEWWFGTEIQSKNKDGRDMNLYKTNYAFWILKFSESSSLWFKSSNFSGTSSWCSNLKLIATATSRSLSF